MNKGIIGLFALALLAGCRGGSPAAEPAPLAGAKIGGDFVLTDQDGKRFDSKALAGRYRTVYFGYTFCPDVCPTDMAVLGQGLKAFEGRDAARAAKIQPIFITVDPERDTPPVLKAFVRAFHPRLIGLTGSPAEIAAVAKKFGIYFRKGEPVKGAEGYMVDHSRQTVLFGPDGAPIALVPTDADAKSVADLLDRWVK